MLQLRHPNVLAFKFTVEVEEKGDTIIYLVTESVKPLADVLGDLAITEDARYTALLCRNHPSRIPPP